MIRNNFLTAFRSFIKNKVYTLINVFGLAMGMACTIIIILYVIDELSFENQHQQGDNIYRVITLGKVGDNEINTANASLPIGGVMKQEFPFIKQFVRVKRGSNMSVIHEKDAYNEHRFYFVDSNVAEVFTIPFVRGNPETDASRSLNHRATPRLYNSATPPARPTGYRRTAPIIMFTTRTAT